MKKYHPQPSVYHFFVFLFFVSLLFFFAGCHSREVGFIYKPAEPHAGQTIIFTNTSEIGSSWSWTFGDGTSSSAKSPSKIFTRSGDYVVTLVVDAKKTLTYSTTVTVLDTMPTIQLADTVIAIYEPLRCAVNYYNPQNIALTYEWLLSDNTQLDDQSALTDSVVTVYFTSPSDAEPIGVVISDGSHVDTVYASVEVRDVESQSLVINYADGKVLRQRIYSQALEAGQIVAQEMDVRHIETYQNIVLLFLKNAIYAIENQEVIQIGNTDKAILGASLLADTLYVKVEAEPLYAVSVSVLKNGNILSSQNQVTDFRRDLEVINNSTYLTNDGKNLCYVGRTVAVGDKEYDMLQNVVSLAVDYVNGKIYFVDSAESQLVVINLNGDEQSRQTIASSRSNHLAIDYDSDRLYFVSGDALCAIPLLHTKSNQTEAQPVVLATEVVSFGFDPLLR